MWLHLVESDGFVVIFLHGTIIHRMDLNTHTHTHTHPFCDEPFMKGTAHLGPSHK